MSSLTKEELKYLRNLVDIRKWKIDQHLEKANGFEKELLFREMLQVASLENKLLNLWEKVERMILNYE